MVDRIETEIQRQAPGEVTSREIGERVMDELHGLDEVAYVRFASVYRQFKDVNQFLDEIQGLVQGDPNPSRPRE
jgi:transcriptional repressor NrdR